MKLFIVFNLCFGAELRELIRVLILKSEPARRRTLNIYEQIGCVFKSSE